VWREFVSSRVRLRFWMSPVPFVRQADARNPVTSNTRRRFGACSSWNARSAMPSIGVPSKGRIRGHSRLRLRLVAARFISGVASAAGTPRAAARFQRHLRRRFLPSPN
jgi:hypothetical protein